MSDPRKMMLRKRKQFGRCRVEGHGDNCYCEVMEDIQGTQFSRAQEKQEVKREIDEQLKELAT